MMSTQPVLVICGPTASGKSAVALRVAQALNGEIISADSMQIYREMDIGTAKVTRQEQALVRHHLIDCCDPGESFSVAKYKQLATKAILEIQARGKLAIVCGGTGQYISALVQGIDYGDLPVDGELRARLNQRVREEGLAVLYDELMAIDAQAAAAVKPQDQKRIIRALEIYYQTGRTKSDHLAASRRRGPDFEYIVFCLSHERSRLYENINRRVDQMLQDGLIDEVRRLASEVPPNGTAWQAIGYKEALAFLAGELSLEETRELIARATRRYAKRQLTWFRRLDSCIWLTDLDIDTAAARIIDRMRSERTKA